VANSLTDAITAGPTRSGPTPHGLLAPAFVTLLLLLLVVLVSTIVARSLIRPLRKLRSDALGVAGHGCPRWSQAEPERRAPTKRRDRADRGHLDRRDRRGRAGLRPGPREAVRLAADEAMLRGNLNAMFINLSRRSQSLIERQLSLIDSLEQSEQDPAGCPACSGWTTWPPACAATPRTCWSWRATR